MHFFKLPNYNTNEILLLEEKIIRKKTNKLYKKEDFGKVIQCYNISEKYSKKYYENGNTFREILKIGN